MRRTIFIGIFFLLTAIGAVSYADIYKYVDESSGITYYTNVTEAGTYKQNISGKRVVTDNPDYSQIIHSMSSKYDIEPSLIRAVITVESNWNYNAVSNKGAIGLMQLMPSTAKDMAVSNPFNPEENIEGGTRYLRFLLDKFNDLPLALAAYNAGPKTVEYYRGVPSITETEQYVKKVLSIYKGKSYNDNSTRIYKVTLDDGTVLFTNTPVAYQNFKVSKL
ncbi:MAG: lytic transglycosylase domain-containing protein [Nitrospirae bacterium]|nr:lytic transglycosylase domain-containing protein [Nitrospirota bacterium]